MLKGETLIPHNYKELIGIAEAAELFGATEQEIQAAVHYVKMDGELGCVAQRDPRDFDTFEELAGIGEHLSSQT